MAALPLLPSSLMRQSSFSFVPSEAATVRSAVRPDDSIASGSPSLQTASRSATLRTALRSLAPVLRDATPGFAETRPASNPSHASPASPALLESPASPASPVDRTEAALREAGLAGRFWRGDALSASPLPSTPSGFRALDEQLPGGGWPSRCLTELLLAHPGVGEIRFLAATLASLTEAGREIVLLAPPHIPDPTGWGQLGIDMRRVLIVRTPRPADRLWALEESLKSAAFGALVAWLPEEKTLARHDALRRLQAAAASANGLSFLMRPFEAQYQPSPAPLRMTLSVGKPEAHRRTLSVRLLKRRGPVLARPLTLMLPEIHRGMKAFTMVPPSVPLPSSSASSAAALSALSASASSAASSAASFTTSSAANASSIPSATASSIPSSCTPSSRTPSSPSPGSVDATDRSSNALAGPVLSDAVA